LFSGVSIVETAAGVEDKESVDTTAVAAHTLGDLFEYFPDICLL